MKTSDFELRQNMTIEELEKVSSAAEQALLKAADDHDSAMCHELIDIIDTIKERIHSIRYMSAFEKELIKTAIIAVSREDVLDFFTDEELDAFEDRFRASARFQFTIEDVIKAVHVAIEPMFTNAQTYLVVAEIAEKAMKQLSAASERFSFIFKTVS